MSFLWLGAALASETENIHRHRRARAGGSGAGATVARLLRGTHDIVSGIPDYM
jgi:hypothetical protein